MVNSLPIAIIVIGVVLVVIALVLFIFSYYSAKWSKEFVDPCCDGMCGRCPPSFWECSFMGLVSMFQVIIGVGLIAIGLWDYLDDNKKK